MPNNSGTSDALLAVGATAPAASKARGPQNVGAAYKGVADSQRMIEAFRCHMQGEMTARNAGKTRRFEGAAIEDPCQMQCDMAARSVGKTLQFESVAIEDQSAAFKASWPHPPVTRDAWPSLNRSMAREAVPCARPRHTTRRQPVPHRVKLNSEPRDRKGSREIG